MHGNLQLILTMTGGLAAALLLGYLTQRMRLSPLVGYLLAGVAIGPFTPGFIADHGLANQMAEIGIILLMFGVGLNFHLKELLAVRRVALPGALIQIVVITGLCTWAALSFGWGLTAGIVFGLAVAIASTVVVVRLLSDRNELHTPAGHIAVGWLVVEDIVCVMTLVLLPALSGPTAGEPLLLAEAIGILLLKLGLLLAVLFVAGGAAIPWLLRKVAETGSRELFTLTTLVVALGIAVGSAELFGVSMALGAFLAGMVVGRSEFALRAAVEALPMRDAFAVLFFVSVGMLFDPQGLMHEPWIIIITLAIILVAKPLVSLALVIIFGYPLRTALSIGMSRGQIGEFSFILAALATSLGLFPDMADDVIVGAAILSISISPLLCRATKPLERWITHRPGLWRWLRSFERVSSMDGKAEHALSIPASHRAVIVGYGPVGQTLDRLLRENEVEPSIIDMNAETVRGLLAQGRHAVYGDSSHVEVLRAAGVAEAAAFFLTPSNMSGVSEIIREVRELNPDAQVIVRCSYLRERPTLFKAGADAVFAEEGEIALAMTEHILLDLGATPEQLDRERSRLHADLSPARYLPAADRGDELEDEDGPVNAGGFGDADGGAADEAESRPQLGS